MILLLALRPISFHRFSALQSDRQPIPMACPDIHPSPSIEREYRSFAVIRSAHTALPGPITFAPSHDTSAAFSASATSRRRVPGLRPPSQIFEETTI
jgi:hypothetical protein